VSSEPAGLAGPAAGLTREHAERADAADDLVGIRDRFQLPAGVIYLDGNSLGALPTAVLPAVRELVEQQWGRDLITSWNEHDWWTLPGRIGNRIGELIGAAAGQVMCGDSTSVQLFQALVAGCRMRPAGSVIITDATNFPTDQYIADAVGQLLGLRVVRIHPSELDQHLSSAVAVVSRSRCWSSTSRRTASRSPQRTSWGRTTTAPSRPG